MKAVAISAVLSALSTVTAAISATHVFTYDPELESDSLRQTHELNPVAARLVLAQRAGVEQYHESDLGREDVIDAINEYGVRTPLFSSETRPHRRVLIMLEGVADPLASLPFLESYTNFQVKSTSAASSKGLFVDLAKQMDPANFANAKDEEVLSRITEFNHFSAHMDMSHHTTSIENFKTLFKMLVAQRHWSITVLATPPEDATFTAQDVSEWGTYEMPTVASVLDKRSPKDREPHQSSTVTHIAGDKQPATGALASNSTVVKGILPACFATQEKCEKSTKNCSGHGKCKLKYHDKTASAPYDCYACSCSATKSEGKTTKWGGPACQKKDISVEFWLIALFTVGLIFVIGFAIGQVWEMGNEELPSVIGAGVSGPTARK